MIIGASLIGGAIAKTIYDINKSIEMDEKALKKYAKAFEKQEEAARLVAEKSELADKRAGNVVKKKRAIIECTFPMFVKVYGKIQKIQIDSSSKNEISFCNMPEPILRLQTSKIVEKKEYSDKELLCGLLTKGLGKTMQMDSERYLAAAQSQLRTSSVIYSQAESIAEVCDAIIERANRISNVLMKMNALFVASIDTTEKTIEKNGLSIKNYSEYEKGILMTCVNMAYAVTDLLNVPVLDADGSMSNSAIEMIEKGELYIKQMNYLTSEGI